MRYFLLGQHPYFKSAFRLMDQKQKVDLAWICADGFYKIPKNLVITVDRDETAAFPDIITSPILLLSTLLLKVAFMFGGSIYSRDVILIDHKEQESRQYHIVLLETIRPGSALWKVRDLFLIDHKGEQEIVASQDLVESILRRGAKGISLKEIQLPIKEDQDV